MCDKQTIRCFFSGFFSVFRFVYTKSVLSKPRNIVTYVFKVEDYIDIAYKSLRNNHERN
jgi:hypothetical protein